MREGEEPPGGDRGGRRGEKRERQGDFEEERKEKVFSDDMHAFDMSNAPAVLIGFDGLQRARDGTTNGNTETRHGLISHN